MTTTLTELGSPPRPVGLRDIPVALLAPRRVMRRVEDVPSYAWPLVVLLALITLIAYATVQTGLIDREVERGVQDAIAKLEREQLDVVERSQLSKMIEETRKQGEFQRLMMGTLAVAAQPLAVLARVLLIAAFFYGLVAMSGRKPEWNTLLTIIVLASFADVAAELARLGLRMQFRTLEVQTSAAVLMQLVGNGSGTGAIPAQARAAIGGLLSAIDPFRIWFWLVVIAGLAATGQMRGWRLWGSCGMLWILAAVVRALAAAGSAAASPAA